MKRFKFMWITLGTGRRAGYVGLDHRFRPPPLVGTNDYVLSDDCDNATEFDAEIDALIDELKELKKSAHRRFARRKSD